MSDLSFPSHIVHVWEGMSDLPYLNVTRTLDETCVTFP